MKNDTLEAFDMFIRTVTKAIRVALPDAPNTVKDVEDAAQDLRALLQSEDVT